MNEKEISEILNQVEETMNKRLMEEGALSPIDVMNEIYQSLGVSTINEIINAPYTYWIPTSEKLPKDGQSVLFCDIDGDIMIGYHIKGRPNTNFSQEGTIEDVKNIEAWMPLPEPYKGE